MEEKKMNGYATRFGVGNKAAEKWTEEETRNIIEKMRDNAENNEDILCLQDAIRSVGLYRTGLDYLLDTFPVFGNLKQDIQDAIVSKINKKALKGEFNATASIWRMKQCGERDESQVNHQNDGGKFERTEPLSNEIIEKLIDKL